MSLRKYTKAVLLMATIVLATARQVCIEQLSGNDTSECIKADEQECCRSLQYVIEKLKDNDMTYDNQISIQGDLAITEVITIEGFYNLTIESENESLLECSTTAPAAGLYFDGVDNLSLKNIAIQKCSMITNTTTTEPNNPSILLQSLSAVYIIDSDTVSLHNVKFQYNIGTGLAMYDTSGHVTITNCVFEGNKVSDSPSMYPGGSGLYIEFTCRSFSTNMSQPCDKSMNESSYFISNTLFRSNSAFELYPHRTKFFNYKPGSSQGLGRGGGLCMIFNGQAINNIINITDCNFTDNNASTWGGGVYISPRQEVHNNIITLSNVDFVNNICTDGGGGGMKLSFLSYIATSSSNRFLAHNCRFTRNAAKTNGGGLALVSSREDNILDLQKQLNNMIVFQNCMWMNNRAELGSAVDLTPGIWHVLGNGLLPVPEFEDCVFENNNIITESKTLSDEVLQVTSGVGTMVVSNFAIVFKGSVKLHQNMGSALYLQSSIVTLAEGSELIISNNTAKRGGAIAFIAFSVLNLEMDTRVVFRENFATIKGGAIYTRSVDKHEKYLSRSCFLQTESKETDTQERNVAIVFEDNRAQTGIGNTLYINSLQPCTFSCNKSDSTLFGCVASVSGLEIYKNEIFTHAKEFQYNDTALHEHALIPGKYIPIPITAYDELNQTLDIEYGLSMKDNNSLQLSNKNSVYLTGQKVQILGPDFMESNTLLLRTDETSVYINVSNTECPPGHYLEDSKCQCDIAKFRGIQKCSRSKKVATIFNGFWIGSCKNGSQCTGLCPKGFCTDNITIRLITTINDTATLLCAKNREGKLCGKCTANHSAYYHSTLNKCGAENLCKYGILFYVLSELVPLTAVFLIIIMTDIRFTSGSASGFILYAQILYSLNINTYKLVLNHGIVQTLSDIHHLIYSTFNLNFFNLEALSFCLWAGARTLDILAWNYVTIVYALLLILLTVWLLNCVMCRKIRIYWRPYPLKNAVIHGLTAFLVMCYSQCARVSFQLLITAPLEDYNKETLEKVIHFSGEQTLFDEGHIYYGFIAIMFLCTIVILPPLALVIYPLCLKFLALCHLSEQPCVTKITNKVPMPLFDSFQSCFKDRYRFFSGLYFLYRLVPLVIYAANPDLVIFYILVEIFLILVLTTHAILQPYKKPKHNIIDTLIFGNLAIINALSLFNYWSVIDSGNGSKNMITTATLFQQVLIFLPLIFIGSYSSWLFSRCTKRRWKKWRRSRLTLKQQHMLDSVYLPPLRSTTNNLLRVGENVRYHELNAK